jgi:ABC-2 type transport system permease protein
MRGGSCILRKSAITSIVKSLASCAPRDDSDFRFMRKFYTLLSREVRSYFYSPIAYMVLVFFLVVSGVDFYFQVSFMNQRPVSYSVQEAFFNSVFFWFAFVLIFPLITMRLFAEEFKLGTIEPLMTAPVRDWQVVLSKFFGALVFYWILWIPTVLYFWIFQQITKQPAATSWGAYWGSYLMLLLLGMFYVSIGCFASVLTKNQIIAAIISFCAITLLFFLGLVQFILLNVSSATRDLLGYFSALEHMGTFSRGVIDTRPIVLYVSMTILMLALTHQAFQSRKWRL